MFSVLNQLSRIVSRKPIDIYQPQCWISVRRLFFHSSSMATDNFSPSSTATTCTEVNFKDSKLFSFCKLVDLNKLSDQEKVIHDRHLEALQKGEDLYEDPKTGYSVLTRLAHLQRGNCCGNACRHCPYGHSNVPEGSQKKTYNSAFFV